jgi:hypothetical protein
VCPVLEGGHDAEVAASSAHRPEQVGILVGVHGEHVEIGGHEFDADEVVYGHAVAAYQPSLATAKGQAADPGRGDHTAGGGEAMETCGLVVVAPPGPALRPHPAGLGIDVHPSHRGEIDHHAAVGDGVAGHVVTASSYGDLALLAAGELEGVADSDVVWQQAMSAGRLSMEPLWTWRAIS